MQIIFNALKWPFHNTKMAGWSQILQTVGNFNLIYLSFDTHDSPGAVFILKWEIFSLNVPVCETSSTHSSYSLHFLPRSASRDPRSRLLWILNIFFAHENIKNCPQKLLIIGPNSFFNIGSAAQTAKKQKSRITGLSNKLFPLF